MLIISPKFDFMRSKIENEIRKKLRNEEKDAMEKAEIEVPGLRARDGLGTINGSNVLTAMSAIFLFDANNWLKQAEIAASMSLEALRANMKPYTSLLHEARGFSGAIRSAKAIEKCVTGGDLKEGRVKCKVQDAYSMRSTPQVIGAAHDALAYARSQVEIELNGVGDNPIFFPDKDLALSGANFQGTPVSVPMEMAGSVITMVIIEADYTDIYEFHTNGHYDITMVAAAKQFHIPYGVCELDNNGGLREIKEKPEFNFLVNTGLYVLNPQILNIIPDSGIFHMTHLMEKVKKSNGTVGVYPISEKSWIDVGQWEEYRKALKAMGSL